MSVYRVAASVEEDEPVLSPKPRWRVLRKVNRDYHPEQYPHRYYVQKRYWIFWLSMTFTFGLQDAIEKAKGMIAESVAKKEKSLREKAIKELKSPPKVLWDDTMVDTHEDRNSLSEALAKTTHY